MARRGFMDGYRRYDPKAEGYGSADEWIAAAEAMAKGVGGFRRQAGVRSSKRQNPALRALGLDALPADLASLKRAFRNAMMVAHPDHGGSNDAARAVMDAYQTLLQSYGDA